MSDYNELDGVGKAVDVFLAALSDVSRKSGAQLDLELSIDLHPAGHSFKLNYSRECGFIKGRQVEK